MTRITEKQHRFGRETLNFSCDERDACKLNNSFAYYSIWFVTCHVGSFNMVSWCRC